MVTAGVPFDEEEIGFEIDSNGADVTVNTTFDSNLETKNESSSDLQSPPAAVDSVPITNAGSKNLPSEIEEPFEENGFVISNSSEGAANPAQKTKRKHAIATAVLLLAATGGCVVAYLATGGKKGTTNAFQKDSDNNNGNPMLPLNTPIPSEAPSSLPTVKPTQAASAYPSLYPSANPTSQTPSVAPSLSSRPSTLPSSQPTPVVSMTPSDVPSMSPTVVPSPNPSFSPSVSPSLSQNPTTSLAPSWSHSPTLGSTETIFYALGDSPYTQVDMDSFPSYIQSIPEDADFAIHLGDIKSQNTPCSEAYNTYVAEELLNSSVPMFIIVGDNEFNDCPNPTKSLAEWKSVFHDFEGKWTHRFNVMRPPERTETFTFVHKRTLYIGTNIPGGRTCCDWSNLMSEQAAWTIDLIRAHTNANATNPVDGVVIFGHASPNASHKNYFETLQEYIRYELKNRVPILYLCADAHMWLYEPNYYNEYNFLRIRVTGGTQEPPLKMVVDPATYGNNPSLAFRYERFWKT